MNTVASSSAAGMGVEIDDVQSGALRPRPVPYEGKFVFLRVDDRQAGRALLRRLLPVTAGGLPDVDRSQDAWVALAFTYQGLRALGVPQESLDSFPRAFREGMAARAELIGDVGESAPAHWEAPFGTGDVHIALSALSSDAAQLDRELERARVAYEDTPGVQVIWQQEVHQLPTGRTTFGFRDGISHPNIEGVGLPGSNPQEAPIKAGEFILGYPDETGSLPPMPSPDVLGRNGTYAAVRKIHTNVAAWRQYLRANTSSAEEEALLAAKMVGRWPSGAPLTLTPEHDDPELAADPHRNNNFLYRENDDRGFRCPAGAHIRRTNPRDSTIIGDARMHRLIRRGTTYGPPLPEGVLATAPTGVWSESSSEHTLNGSLNSSRPSGSTTATSSATPARRTRWPGITAEPAVSPSRRSRSGAVCGICRASWSPGAVSTASCRVCVPCAGSPSWRTEDNSHPPRGPTRSSRRGRSHGSTIRPLHA
ncbi:Dyp-type peroxidase [Streptomyces mirabilis]|uniref:Dyp-type peroxidase n=1 Tax=Streptomyces mirabilis TaxID=68239 RepID=UPI0036DC7FAC